MISPAVLQQNSIKYYRMVQNPGDFVITYPGSYHAGFNMGFNIAESTNFATNAWIEIGATAKACECADDSVRIDMRLFGVDTSSLSKKRRITPAQTGSRSKRMGPVVKASAVVIVEQSESESEQDDEEDEEDEEEEDEEEEIKMDVRKVKKERRKLVVKKESTESKSEKTPRPRFASMKVFVSIKQK